MIKTQEFRIGNYYQGASRGNIETVTWQTLRDLSEGKLNLMPIPLTEEILLKFGFLEDDNFYHLNNIWISNFYENYFSLDGFDETKIEYIHQLQNLYFALTGKDLSF